MLFVAFVVCTHANNVMTVKVFGSESVGCQ